MELESGNLQSALSFTYEVNNKSCEPAPFEAMLDQCVCEILNKTRSIILIQERIKGKEKVSPIHTLFHR